MHHSIYIVDRQGRYRRVDYLQPQESRLAEPLDAVPGAPHHPSYNPPGSETAPRYRGLGRGR